MLATLDHLGVRWRGRGLLDRLPSRGSRREVVGRRLARALATSEHGHQRALTLVDELVAINRTAAERAEPARVAPPRQTPDRALEV
jgi:hypothetical protein